MQYMLLDSKYHQHCTLTDITAYINVHRIIHYLEKSTNKKTSYFDRANVIMHSSTRHHSSVQSWKIKHCSVFIINSAVSQKTSTTSLLNSSVLLTYLFSW